MAMKAKELAQLLGVSAATMSLVLNNKPGISDGLRQSLVSKIRDLGYGYMLKGEEDKQKEKKIAYLSYADRETQEGGFAFYPPVLEGVEREARRQGYQLMVVHMDQNMEPSYLYGLHEACAGLVVQAEKREHFIEEQLEMIDLPAVTMSDSLAAIGILSVCINHELGMQKAVSYLQSRGHRLIGFVGTDSDSDAAKERRRYFRLALLEAGLAYRPAWDVLFVPGKGEEERLIAALRCLWAVPCDAPSAFVLESDILAPAVYRALRLLGKRIPQDVSVVGFDGRAICSMLEPTLTTVRVPRRFLGRLLMTSLARRLEWHSDERESVAVRVKVDAELVIMESVGERRQIVGIV